jgi:(p)ppGpp synthase/HD superfamily hydrolase
MELILTSRFEDALLYATRLHAQQKRKVSGNPYIAHLLSVAALVLEDGGTEEEAIAALLHDAIEDQGGDPTRQEIRRRFGDKVTEIVNGCTDAETLPKPPWQERKEKFIASLATASPQVLRVTTADKLDNVRSLLMFYGQFGPSVWENFKGKRDGTIWYYEQVTKVLRARSNRAMVQALEKAVEELKFLK